MNDSQANAVPPEEPAAGGANPLVARLTADLARRWHEGERPRAEDLLARHPELWDNPDDALDLIYEEFCLRQECGQAEPASEFVQRFPEHRDQLEVLLACHDALAPVAAPALPRFPEVGEEFGGFRLLAELGRGALGRVFLATQPALADRPVVLKLTPRTGGEHLSLARLQHTHIVPLYAVQDDPAGGLRALCMPYFGGASLAQLLEAVQAVPYPQRRGHHLLVALDEAQARSPVPLPGRGPVRQHLGSATFEEALCWIAARLADGLHYAHERGLLHLDVKPSNVLLAADGTPMLLDFHLAHPPLAPGGPPPSWVGGTLAFMSREQHAALAAVSADRPVPLPVDARADVFSLGALLYGAFGGQLPYLPGASPPLRRVNPHVSVGLSDILQRCLAYDAADRYPDAAALADDLRRHCASEPLRGVRNRSPRERWRKWRRRQPHGLLVAGLAVVLVTALVGALALGWDRWRVGQRQLEATLEAGREQARKGHLSEADEALTAGLAAAERRVGGGELAARFARELREVRWKRAAGELHLFVERVRFLYPFDPDAPAPAGLDERCGALWGRVVALRERAAADLGAETDGRLRRDLLDLAVVWADLRVRLAGGDADGARRAGLRLLDEAETLLGPSPALAHERRGLARALGLPVPPDGPPPRTAWEHYVLGRAHLRDGDLGRAADELRQARALDPAGLWPNYAWGQCAYRGRRYGDALTAFSVCVGAAPAAPGVNPAVLHYNLAVVYLARDDSNLNDRGAAAEELRLALRHQPDHPQARDLLARLESDR